MHPDLVRHRDELERLCRQYHGRRLELFGSAAVGLDRPGESDFDFLVEFELVTPGEHANAFFLGRQTRLEWRIFQRGQVGVRVLAEASLLPSRLLALVEGLAEVSPPIQVGMA